MFGHDTVSEPPDPNGACNFRLSAASIMVFRHSGTQLSGAGIVAIARADPVSALLGITFFGIDCPACFWQFPTFEACVPSLIERDLKPLCLRGSIRRDRLCRSGLVQLTVRAEAIFMVLSCPPGTAIGGQVAIPDTPSR